MNAATIITLLALMAVSAAIIVYLTRRKRRHTCGCGCSSCPYSKDCEHKPR